MTEEQIKQANEHTQLVFSFLVEKLLKADGLVVPNFGVFSIQDSETGGKFVEFKPAKKLNERVTKDYKL